MASGNEADQTAGNLGQADPATAPSEGESVAVTLPAEPEAPAASVDPARQALVATLRQALGEAVLDHHIAGGDVWVRVANSAWRQAYQVARQELGMSYFCYLSAIDWKQNPELGGQKLWDPDADAAVGPGDGPGNWLTGVAGGDTRFQVIARVYNVTSHLGLHLKADAGDDDPRIESLVPLCSGADWHEREAWEMYGIDFEGHPGLRHLYLPGEFEGHPLRKDFPLLAREVKPWPGLVNVEGLPGEPESGEAAPGAEGEA